MFYSASSDEYLNKNSNYLVVNRSVDSIVRPRHHHIVVPEYHSKYIKWILNIKLPKYVVISVVKIQVKLVARIPAIF